uniref:Uncharacterized protein n=1 Tax=Tetranychus urticae TaxID=32264 RepID=T1JYB9_TETUR
MMTKLTIEITRFRCLVSMIYKCMAEQKASPTPFNVTDG